MAVRGYRTIKLDLPRTKGTADVFTSARVADALREITKNATLYEGVRLTQVMEAVYLQGRKDGAREAFDGIDRSVSTVKALIPHRRPGRPRKPRRRLAGRLASRKSASRKSASRKSASRKSARRKSARRK